MNINHIFQTYIENGDFLEAVEFYHENEEIIDIHLNDEDAFYNSCVTDNLEQTMWLYELSVIETTKKHFGLLNKQAHIIPTQTIDHIFYLACINNRMKFAKWLHSIGAKMTPIAFDVCIDKGHLHMAYWLYKAYNLTSSVKYLFEQCCENNEHLLIKRICNKSKIKITSKLLHLVCNTDNVETIKFIIKYAKLDSINKLYQNSIKFDNLKIAEYLYKAYDIKTSDKNIVITHIESDDLETIKGLHVKYPAIFNEYKDCYLIYNSRNDNFEAVTWLLATFTFQKCFYTKAFICASKIPDSRTMKHIGSTYPIKKHTITGVLFDSCIYGEYKNIEWMCKNNVFESKILDQAFEISCRFQNFHVAKWFTQTNDTYYTTVHKQQIFNFGKKSNELIAYEHFKNNHYPEAIKALNITKQQKCEVIEDCFICRDNTSTIIKLNCNHYGCIECLLTWFTKTNPETETLAHPVITPNENIEFTDEILKIIKNECEYNERVVKRMKGMCAKELRCMYCQNEIVWADCCLVSK